MYNIRINSAVQSCQGDVAVNTAVVLEIAVAKESTGTEVGSMLLLLLAFLNKYSLATCFHTLGSFFFFCSFPSLRI